MWMYKETQNFTPYPQKALLLLRFPKMATKKQCCDGHANDLYMITRNLQYSESYTNTIAKSRYLSQNFVNILDI